MLAQANTMTETETGTGTGARRSVTHFYDNTIMKYYIIIIMITNTMTERERDWRAQVCHSFLK